MKNLDHGLTRCWNKAGVANGASGSRDKKGWKFSGFARGKSLAQCILALLIAGASALWLAPASSGQTVTVGGSMEGNLPVNPGDTISAGYDFSMPGTHPGATVTVTGGIVQVNVICADGSAQTLTMALPEQSYTVGANDNSWYPSPDQSSSLVYQGSVMAPATLCGGHQGNAPNGATMSAIFQSTDATDPLDVRFHYSDRSAGGWSGSVNANRRGGSGAHSSAPVFMSPGLSAFRPRPATSRVQKTTA